MNRAEIVLTRIDNRLVHGQVGITWTNSLDVDTIVVIDNDVAVNPMRQKLMESVARAASVQISFYTIKGFLKTYFESDSQQKLYLVVNDPHIVHCLVEDGVPIVNVNVGNMHYERGKVALNRKVYLDEKDIEDINYLIKQNVNVYYQDVPGSIIEKIKLLDYQFLKKKH